MKFASIAILLLVLFAFPSAGPVNGQDLKPGDPLSWEIVPCPVTLPVNGEIEGRTYDCGVVTVPENYDAPNGRTIELAYLRLRSASPTPAADPLVYLAGGPGGSGLHEFSTFEVMLATAQRWRQDRDVLVYDQRGTGHSGRLACAPFTPAIGLVAEQRPDLAPVIDEINSGIGQQALFFGACASGYKTKGLDLSQYNSIASAHDIAELTRVLGYTGSYNLYGTSYGTRLALVAMRTTPARIRSVVLDGVVSPSVPGVAYTSAKLYEQYQNIFAQCAAAPACNAAYPDLDRRFVALLTRIGASPVVVDPPIQTRQPFGSYLGAQITAITPDFFVGLTDVNNLSTRGGFAFIVPRLIHELEQNDTTLLRQAISQPTAPGGGAPALTPAIRTGEEVIIPDQKFFAATIHVLLERAASASSAPQNLSQAWAARAITDLRQRLLAGERQADIVMAMVQLSLVPTEGPQSEALVTYANKSMSPSAASDMNAMVAQMSRHDVRLTMWSIQDLAAVLGGGDERGLAPGMMLAVNCAEEMSFTSREVAQRYIDAAPYPGLVRFDAEAYEGLYLFTCQFFPKTRVERSIMDPVVSDIPALLFVESMDIQTPRSFGLKTRETLSRSYLVEWLSEGHVIANRSPDGCAGAIAAAFLADPLREPDAACSKTPAYTIPYSLPDAPSPFAPTP